MSRYWAIDSTISDENAVWVRANTDKEAIAIYEEWLSKKFFGKLYKIENPIIREIRDPFPLSEIINNE